MAPGAELGERCSDEDVAGVAPLGDRRQAQARWVDGLEILGRMDGRIGLAVEHGGLHLAHEHAPAAHFPHGDFRAAVARSS